MAELLVGALVAIWWFRRGPLRTVHRHLIVWAGALALVVMLLLWHVAERTTTAFYHGGLVAYAVLTSAVILAAVQPGGPVRRALGWRPLVYIGTISYGAYLLHWPILVWLQLRTPLSSWARLAVGFAVTVLLAAVLYRLVEHPIRTRRRLATGRGASAAIVGVGAVAALILVATAVSPKAGDEIDFEAAANRFNAADTPEPTLTPEQLAGLTPEDRLQLEHFIEQRRAIATSDAPRFAAFGDSTALLTTAGLTNWSIDNLDVLSPATGSAELGCGLLSGVVRSTDGVEIPAPTECDGYLDRWIAATEATPIDIALVEFGPWEVHDHQLTPDGPILTIGKDAALDDALREQLDRAIVTLADRVGYVIVLTSPDVTFQRVDGRDPPRSLAASDPARMARFREIVDEVVARHADRVGVIDVAGYLDGNPDEHRLRPDGVHLTQATATEVAAWLGPEIRDLYDRAAD
jgi:hypothetical protein